MSNDILTTKTTKIYSNNECHVHACVKYQSFFLVGLFMHIVQYHWSLFKKQTHIVFESRQKFEQRWK